ncbi:MAG: carbohydrate-binding domain-containing protein [Ruminococcus sp.]|nr:carbohydrate-binding domain-containing protein [Oscillospiraceae bacterium]MBP3309965.1 carbohydrate-binding domain-containing protein [Ruminococcus sp.]
MKKPMKWLKRTAAFAVTLGAVLFAMPASVSAATEFNINNGAVTITADGDYTITGDGTATANTITVESGVSANITLAGVNIDVSSQNNKAAFKIADNSAGNVTITLADGTTNTLKSGRFCAGLQKNGEYSEDLGTLTIQGTGSLTATGGEYNAAGIGSGSGGNCSNITIEGGIITANGGEYNGAGIGGGQNGNCSNITIKGGEITANGGNYGAGIGGGYKGSGSGITINGGTVTANGGDSGAGIGGGLSGDGSNITIEGGTVTANGGDSGAGIGGGSDGGDGSNITIEDGTVTANGGKNGAGIGGGWCGDGSGINISNSLVKVTAGANASSIGGGRGGNGAADLSNTQNAIIVDNTARTVTVYGNVTLNRGF